MGECSSGRLRWFANTNIYIDQSMWHDLLSRNYQFISRQLDISAQILVVVRDSKASRFCERLALLICSFAQLLEHIGCCTLPK